MRLVDRQLAEIRLELRQYRPRLEAYAGLPPEHEAVRYDGMRLSEGRIDVAIRDAVVKRKIACQCRVNRRGAVVEGRFDRVDGGQLLPFDRNKLDGVLSLGARVGDNCGNRFALPARLIDDEGRLGRRAVRRQAAKIRGPRRAQA